MAEYINKIKAIDPQIIVDGNIDKPYYSIRYYDTSDNIWHIGFSSYELKFVVEWLKTEFDVVESEVEPIRRGKWVRKENTQVYWYACSLCGEKVSKNEYGDDYFSDFCPNCGAAMFDGKE